MATDFTVAYGAKTQAIDPNAPTPFLDASLAQAKAPAGPSPAATTGAPGGANEWQVQTEQPSQWQVASEAPRPSLESKGELAPARVGGALQGALAGFGDEFLGGVGATADQLGIGRLLTGEHDPHSWGQDYEKYRDEARRQFAEYRTERPWESFGATAAGALLTVPAAGAAARGVVGAVSPATATALTAGRAGVAARAAEGATAGGIVGGATGFGSGEGGVGNRALGAGAGAAGGATVGGALPVIGAAVISPALNWIGARLGFLHPERRAAEIIGGHVARAAGGTAPPNLGQAARQISGQSANSPVPLALADMTDSLRSMAGAASRRPGEARDILTDWASHRQLGNPVMGQAGGGQWSGMLDDVAQTVHPSVSAHDLSDRIIQARATASRPLYEQFRNLGPLASPELRELAQIPAMRTALAEGRNMAQQEGALSSRTPYDPNSANNAALPGEAWHYAKMAIDDLIGAARRAGENAKARTLGIMQTRLLNALHDASGGVYTQARETFAGPSALLNALEEGQEILTKAFQPDDILRQVQAYSAGEREMYLAGVAQALRNLVMNTSRQNNAGASILNVPAVSEKLRAAFGNWQNFAQFMGRIGARSDQFRTFAEIMKGSPTAARMAADDALTQGIEQGAPTNAMAAYAQGGRHGLLRWFSDHINNAGNLLGVSERVRVSIARMLIADNPAAIRRAAQMIDDAARAGQSRQVVGSAVRRGAAQGLTVGTIVNGYRWSGGDPHSQQSWEPVN